MTSHELARLWLDGPDEPVVVAAPPGSRVDWRPAVARAAAIEEWPRSGTYRPAVLVEAGPEPTRPTLDPPTFG